MTAIQRSRNVRTLMPEQHLSIQLWAAELWFPLLPWLTVDGVQTTRMQSPHLRNIYILQHHLITTKFGLIINNNILTILFS